MEENKVATDKELRERAERIAEQVYLDTDLDSAGRRKLLDAIFRELVAVRNATIKKVLVYEADVAAYESYCVGRGEKP